MFSKRNAIKQSCVAFTLAVLVVLGNQTASLAQASDTTFATTEISAIDEISKNILLKEIECERFNIHFRQEYAKQGRWKGLRYFASQEANGGALLGGLVAAIAIRAHSLAGGRLAVDAAKGPQTVYPPPNKNALTNALIPQLVGQIVGASGDGIELAINAFHAEQARLHGYDPARASRHAAQLKDEVWQLLNSRKRLIENCHLSDEQKQVLQMEGQLLSDLNDITQAEFRYFYLSRHRLLAFQTALYLFDIGRNVTGAIGNGLGIIANNNSNLPLNGPSNVLTTISGGLILAMPVVSRLLGKADQIIESKRLDRLLGAEEFPDTASFNSHRQELKELLDRQMDAGSAPGTIGQRLSLYAHESFLNFSSLQIADKEIEMGRRVDVDNIAAGEIIGATKLTNGILGTVAGYKYPTYLRANLPLIMDGNIAFLSGTGMGLADNIRLQVVSEYDRYKLQQERKLPEQVFADRLNFLEAEEATVRKL
jgi:hypothetical protein